MNIEFNTIVGKRLRQQRELLGLTRENLCELTGISVQFIADIERGKKGLSVESLSKLCKSLNMSADYVIFGRNKLNDVEEISHLLEMIDKKYLGFALEHLRVFLKTISQI